MKEVKGNIWTQLKQSDVICITTNGFVRKDGRCTMGAGIALQARKKFKNIDKQLGRLIKENGPKVQVITYIGRTNIVAFPTKPAIANMNKVLPRLKNRDDLILKGLLKDCIPGWAAISDIEIIERSCKQLVELVDNEKWKHVCLTRPGCGNGGLEWSDVKLVLDKYLTGDRFSVFY